MVAGAGGRQTAGGRRMLGASARGGHRASLWEDNKVLEMNRVTETKQC